MTLIEELARGWCVRAVRVSLLLVVTLCFGCESQRQSLLSLVGLQQSTDAEQTSGASKVSKNVAVSVFGRSFIDEAELCEVRHRGISVDLGSDWSNAHRSFYFGPFDDVDGEVRSGTPTGAIRVRRIGYDFWLDRPATGVEIALRGVAGSSPSMAVYVDGVRLGERRLPSTLSRVLRFNPVTEELASGRHNLLLSFRGAAKAEPFARIEWVRVYLEDGDPSEYVPPTKTNVMQDVSIARQPYRSFALSPNSSVRCPVTVSSGSRLKVNVAYWGEGSGLARVSAVLSNGRRMPLAVREVKSADDARWQPLDLSFQSLQGDVVAIELESAEGTSAGRVVFGDPKIEVSTRMVANLQAQNVVIVVFGGMSQRLVPPWGSRTDLAGFSMLADEGIAFDRYFASSSIVAASVGTLLSAAHPRQHQVLDLAAKLPDSIPLLSESLRAAGGRAAFFTNVPYTFSDFGFNRGWHTFEQASPVEDRPVTEPFLRGRRWFEQAVDDNPDGRKLLVVHARGGHPPWDLSAGEIARLEPADYSGVIEARRGAIALRRVRDRVIRRRRKLGPRDWQRLEAMQMAALQKQDAAMHALFLRMKEQEQWDNSLVVVVGDVAMGDEPNVPFSPSGELDRSRLVTPLFVKPPAAVSTQVRVGRLDARMVSGPELARTLYEAFELNVPPAFGGRSLRAHLLNDGSDDSTRVLAVNGDRYVYFAQNWRLKGSIGRQPDLCDVEVDPSCERNVYAESPTVVHWLWRSLIGEVTSLRKGSEVQREAVTVDVPTRAALEVYGL